MHEVHASLYLEAPMHQQAVGIEMTSQQTSSPVTQPESISLSKKNSQNQGRTKAALKKQKWRWRGRGKRNSVLENRAKTQIPKVRYNLDPKAKKKVQ